MKQLALLLVLTAPLFAQDAPKQDISKLAEDLGSDDYNIREAATKALIDLGEGIIPDLQALEKSDDSEVVGRARKAISTILRNKEIAKYYKPTKPLTMEFTGTVGAFLAKLAAQTGVQYAPTINDRNVTVSVKNATLMQALDKLCYNLRDVRWKYRRDGVVDFVREWDAYDDTPAFYHSSFRVSVGKTESLRTSFFKTEVGGVIFSLTSQVDHTTQPTDPVDFSVHEVVDANGCELTAGPTDPAQIALMARLSHLPYMQSENPFRFVGLTKGAKKLKKIRGVVGYYFPLNTQKVVFETPAQGATQEIGQFIIRIDNVTSGQLTFTITKGSGPTVLDRHFSASLLTVIGKDGRTWNGSEGDGNVSHTQNGPLSSTYNFYWYNGGDIVKVEMNVVTEYYYLQLPFELNDIPLP